jgi:hypothetical protein
VSPDSISLYVGNLSATVIYAWNKVQPVGVLYFFLLYLFSYRFHFLLFVKSLPIKTIEHVFFLASFLQAFLIWSYIRLKHVRLEGAL